MINHPNLIVRHVQKVLQNHLNDHQNLQIINHQNLTAHQVQEVHQNHLNDHQDHQIIQVPSKVQEDKKKIIAMKRLSER